MRLNLQLTARLNIKLTVKLRNKVKFVKKTIKLKKSSKKLILKGTNLYKSIEPKLTLTSKVTLTDSSYPIKTKFLKRLGALKT
jgi:hypothetical protein